MDKGNNDKVTIYNAAECTFLDPSYILEQIKSSPKIKKAGMILLHNGIVRAFSRNGLPITQIRTAVDIEKLKQIINEALSMKGIIDVRVVIREGDLKIGEDMMLLAVCGDIRENVISCLSNTLDRIKKEAISKKEH